MVKKVLIIVSILAFMLIMWIIFSRSLTQDNVVSNEDIKINILDIEEKKENTFYITVEIANNSSLDLEKNNIFIDSLNFNNNSTEETRDSPHNASESNQNNHELEEDKALDLEIEELEGNFSNIPRGKYIRIGITFQLEKESLKPLLFVFRSDQIRNDDKIKTHYTTITKELNISNN